MDEIKKFRKLFEESVRQNMCEGILFSGGLDTAIVALLASKIGKPQLFTIHIKNSEGADIGYNRHLAKQLKLKQHMLELTVDELKENIPKTIKILKTFDPMEVRNSVTIYCALDFAKDHVKSVMTGDGADELFAGYSYMFKKSEDELRDYTIRLDKSMRFSSTDLGEVLGVKVNIPYIQEDVRSFAVKLDPRFKVGIKDGVTYGKWIVRKAFEGDLADDFIWRVKTPIEFGSGSTILTSFFESEISDDEFERKKREYETSDAVKLQDKEQLHYYESYREIFGPPQPSRTGGCPRCNSEIKGGVNFCRVCGAYPVGGGSR